MSKWDGTYESTKESKDGLEGDILRALEGRKTMETSTGGTMRMTERTRVDIYEKDSSGNQDHIHDGYNMRTGETYGH